MDSLLLESAVIWTPSFEDLCANVSWFVRFSSAICFVSVAEMGGGGPCDAGFSIPLERVWESFRAGSSAGALEKDGATRAAAACVRDGLFA